MEEVTVNIPVGEVIRNAVTGGWAVESSGDTYLTFVGPEPPRTNHTLHGLLSLFIPFYFIVWIVVSLSKKPQRQHLTYRVADGLVDTDSMEVTQLYPRGKK